MIPTMRTTATSAIPPTRYRLDISPGGEDCDDPGEVPVVVTSDVVFVADAVLDAAVVEMGAGAETCPPDPIPVRVNDRL
jgi:hypothetical protein